MYLNSIYNYIFWCWKSVKLNWNVFLGEYYINTCLNICIYYILLEVGQLVKYHKTPLTLSEINIKMIYYLFIILFLLHIILISLFINGDFKIMQTYYNCFQVYFTVKQVEVRFLSVFNVDNENPSKKAIENIKHNSFRFTLYYYVCILYHLSL